MSRILTTALMRGARIALINNAKQIKVTGRRGHFIQSDKPSGVAISLTFDKDHKAIDLLRKQRLLPVLYPDFYIQNERHMS